VLLQLGSGAGLGLVLQRPVPGLGGAAEIEALLPVLLGVPLLGLAGRVHREVRRLVYVFRRDHVPEIAAHLHVPGVRQLGQVTQVLLVRLVVDLRRGLPPAVLTMLGVLLLDRLVGMLLPLRIVGDDLLQVGERVRVQPAAALYALRGTDLRLQLPALLPDRGVDLGLLLGLPLVQLVGALR
jgi:hypothetical protein